MMLDVKGVSKLLAVSEKTVYQWIAKNEIPVYKVGEGYRFSRVELLEWATAKKMEVSYKIFDGSLETSDEMPSLAETVIAGGIHYRIPGIDRESVLKSIVEAMRLPSDVDKEFLVSALMAREGLGTTAIGDGIAIPHVRDPIIFHINEPVLALCFLEQPIDFQALDGKAVDTVFTIITHTIRSHLHMLSRLSYALHQPGVRSVINSSSSRQMILDALINFEESLNPQSAGKL